MASMALGMCIECGVGGSGGKRTTGQTVNNPSGLSTLVRGGGGQPTSPATSIITIFGSPAVIPFDNIWWRLLNGLTMAPRPCHDL